MSSALPQVGAIARRSVVRTSRQPASIIPPLDLPVALMAVNAGGLRSSTELPGFPTDSFLAFALAVPFIQGALFSTMNAGTDLARDIQTGFVNRLSLTALRGLGAPRRPARRSRRARDASRCSSTSSSALTAGVRVRVGAGGHRSSCSSTGRSSRSRSARSAAWLAFRTGSGETIQALFPVLFVFLFISSMNTPRNLIGVDWFRIAATLNPVSYMIECVRSLIITGWDPAGARCSGSGS